MRLFAILILWMVAVPAFAGEKAPSSALNRMLAAREAGQIDAPDFYSATSADVPAYYLMAYTWNRSLPLEHRRKQAAELLLEITAKANRNGSCVGWGIGSALDAFGDGSVNPSSTIYLYTSARVVRALIEADRAGLITVSDQIFRDAACSFKTLFHFSAEPPRLQYSDQANDAGYLVYNVFADLIVAATDLAEKTGDVDLRTMAMGACAVLIGRTGADGYLPYFEGRSSTDPTHHAMVLNGLIRCHKVFGIGQSAVNASAAYYRRTTFPNGEFQPGDLAPEWVAGESLIALTDLCRSDRSSCDLRDNILRYVDRHERNGAVNNRAPRYQSWLAAGLSYVLNAE